MQHNLIRILRIIPRVPLGPIITDRIRKDISRLVECRADNRAADFGITLETVLGVLVPEVEGAVTTGSAERSVDGVERDCVDGVHF